MLSDYPLGCDFTPVERRLAKALGWLKAATATRGGKARTVLRALNLEDETDRRSFLAHKTLDITIPRSERRVTYDPMKRIGIGVSKLGASKAVAIGAYHVAVTRMAASQPANA